MSADTDTPLHTNYCSQMDWVLCCEELFFAGSNRGTAFNCYAAEDELKKKSSGVIQLKGVHRMVPGRKMRVPVITPPNGGANGAGSSGGTSVLGQWVEEKMKQPYK